MCALESKLREISYIDDESSLLILPLEEKHAEMIHSAVLSSRENLKPFMSLSVNS